MKYFKKIIFWVIGAFLIGFLFFLVNNKEKLIKTYLSNKGDYIKIHKNKVIMYNNKDEIINDYLLEDRIIEYAIGDITGNNKDKLVLLTKDNGEEYGKDVIIFSLENEMEEIYRKNFSEFKPWKIAIGDIDGDGVDDISIGVYKESPLHQVMAKRPFIYSFKDGVLQPKWRGSRLSRPFDDYVFYDIDGDGIDEIISIEILKDNRKIINSYKWKGFGFEGYLESESFGDMESLIIKEGGVYLNIKEGSGIYLGLLKVGDKNLEIERVD